MKSIFDKIINENPTFVLFLGMCPALAITTKVENAYMMGICVLIIVLFTNIVVSLTKNLVPENVKIPIYILIIGTFVTITELLLKRFIPSLYGAFGVYLPLIVVNCIVLGRAISVARKENIKNSIIDAFGIGLGFTFSLIVISLFREILGTNTITLMDSLSSITGYKAIYKVLPNTNVLPISFLATPAGAFMTLGILAGIYNSIKGVKKDESD